MCSSWRRRWVFRRASAQLAQRYYSATATNGWSGRYFPAVIEVVDRNIELPSQP